VRARRGAAAVPAYAVLRPDRQPPDPRRPFPHQREAWDRLDAFWAGARFGGKDAGLLVMPTGAGKTYTAAAWLTRNVVDGGGRVLWLAHSDALLEQAAAAFHRAARLAARRRTVAVRVVSSRHCGAATIGAADDVVVATPATLARHPGALAALLADPRTVAVGDEAHHAHAATLRAILERPAGGRRPPVLGLTATPTRTRPDERQPLLDLFDHHVIYEADAADLVERGVLARPVLVRVRTDIRVDKGLTKAERAGLGVGDDPGAAWLRRVARLERRNRVAVEHYLSYRERYGKTLIFAIDVDQAGRLTQALCDAGVAADFVACRRDVRDNRKALERFRDPRGLDVLANVQLLTEGVDLPLVRTVLLARPTASPILLAQMIGRALRGPAAGGTEVAYVVALEDDWGRHPGWPDPADLVPFEAEEAAVTRPAGSGRGPAGRPARFADEALAARVRSLAGGHAVGAAESLPERWYVLGPAGAGRAVAVYGHERAAWEAAVEYLAALPAGALAAATAADLAARFFGGGAPPAPSARDLGRLVGHFRAGGGIPASYGVVERRTCDPRAVARRIAKDDLTETDRVALLAERYTPLAAAIYPTPRAYRAAVEDALHQLEHPEEAAWGVPLAPVFEEV
jgi:superfamily II DNA or RNA helicase